MSNSIITITMDDDHGQIWPESWLLVPFASEAGKIPQPELTERIAADLAAGKFSIKVTHVTESEQVIR